MIGQRRDGREGAATSPHSAAVRLSVASALHEFSCSGRHCLRAAGRPWQSSSHLLRCVGGRFQQPSSRSSTPLPLLLDQGKLQVGSSMATEGSATASPSPRQRIIGGMSSAESLSTRLGRLVTRESEYLHCRLRPERGLVWADTETQAQAR
jgi:hypothetical protein